MKRILVTGGAGFLGAHLCKSLLEDGHFVVCMDNFWTSERTNIEGMLSNDRFELIEQDVEEEIIGKDIDEIYNLACPASPPHYQANSLKTMRTSVLGMFNVLELADKLDAKVLQASTSEIYGEPEVHPQSETYRGNVNTLGPRSCYDEGKRAAETILMDYKRTRGVNARIARIFNTYGPGMHPYDGRVVSNFILQALSGKPLTIYGDGSQTRSFCYVSDLVDGLKRLMANDFVDAVNLGNPAEFTVKELAMLVLQMTGREPGEIEYRALPMDDPTRRRPDISRAIEYLNWTPKVELKEGLFAAISYFINVDIDQYIPPAPPLWSPTFC